MSSKWTKFVNESFAICNDLWICYCDGGTFIVSITLNSDTYVYLVIFEVLKSASNFEFLFFLNIRLKNTGSKRTQITLISSFIFYELRHLLNSLKVSKNAKFGLQFFSAELDTIEKIGCLLTALISLLNSIHRIVFSCIPITDSWFELMSKDFNFPSRHPDQTWIGSWKAQAKTGLW